MFFRFGRNLRRSDSWRLFLFFEIEGSEREKKYRAEHEEHHGLGKTAEKIENGGEDEMYEEKKDVHPLRS